VGEAPRQAAAWRATAELRVVVAASLLPSGNPGCALSRMLRYRMRESLEVLQAEAKGAALIAFEASEAIKRWEEGDWHLDPDG